MNPDARLGSFWDYRHTGIEAAVEYKDLGRFLLEHRINQGVEVQELAGCLLVDLVEPSNT
jgi:hypothetical protein